MNGNASKGFIAACALACALRCGGRCAPAAAVAAARPPPPHRAAVAAAAPTRPLRGGCAGRARHARGQPGHPHPGSEGRRHPLNRDLLVLEEELLFPASTQVALFVSMDVGKLFELDSVQIKLDDKVVANYLYTPREVEALHRGGVQRLYLGNLRAGEHALVAFFTGKGPHERDYKRGATLKFDKGTDAEVHRAAHQGLAGQAAARVRRQGLAVGGCMARSRQCTSHGRGGRLRHALRRLSGAVLLASAAATAARGRRAACAPSKSRTTATRCSTSTRTTTSRPSPALMVSQHFDRVARHADEAEVLRGGMLLSYGMHREAGEIFARLIDKGAPPPVRDRAWFYLAKIRYQRGYLAEAEGRARPHRQALARRAGRRARAAAGQPADRAGRLRRRRERAVRPRRPTAAQGRRARHERRALRPLQPRRRADQERRRGAGQRAARRDRQRRRQRRRTAQPARPRQPGAGLCGAGRTSSPRRRAASSSACA